MDEELEVQEEVVLEHLPEGVLRDIICIAGWLVENGRNQGAASWTRLMLCWLDTFLGGPILSPCGLFSYFIIIESKCCIKELVFYNNYLGKVFLEKAFVYFVSLSHHVHIVLNQLFLK